MNTSTFLGREVSKLSLSLSLSLSLLFLIIGNLTFSFSQNTEEYLFEIKDGYELDVVTKTVNPDQTILLNMANSSLATILNSKTLYNFKKAFPTSVTPKLQRVYIITALEGSTFNEFNSKPEIENHFKLNDVDILTDSTPSISPTPND
ncbi:MAG: hypothetical protein CMC70_06675 [Flavobacteriaceae bacterium]|nr:hypothetical protein [Flavobacteriaceae bacterium]